MKRTEPENRISEPVRITSEQYKYLQDTLFRREDLEGKLAQRGRRARHILAIVTIVFVVIFFSAPDFQLSLAKIGIAQDLTLQQLYAIAPLVLAYLILYTCHIGATRLRLIHECKAVELELEKFGAPTAYSAMRRYRSECMKHSGLWQNMLSTTAFLTVYSLYDLFLVISVVVAFIGSAIEGLKIFLSIYQNHPHAAVAFIVYLGIAIIVSLVAPVALRLSRKWKDDFMDRYIEEALVEKNK